MIIQMGEKIFCIKCTEKRGANMYYDAELEYLSKVLHKMHVQITRLNQKDILIQNIDFGLRKFLGREDMYQHIVWENFDSAKDKTIYKLTDELMCKYLFLRLPENPGTVPLIIGPYMSFDMSHERLLEEAERLGVPAWRVPALEAYYSNIPVLKDEAVLLILVGAFGEVLWGSGKAFEIIDINRELGDETAPIASWDENVNSENTMLRMEMMEVRYNYENELMQIVSQGLAHRAEMMLSNFSKTAFDQRTADPIRNVRNYSIICSTLLRKAAEQGGVHPIYLDRLSSDFAKRIENITSIEAGQRLMNEMAHAYCRLVRKYAIRRYSPVVQKTVTYIDGDLSSDLSLSVLASVQNMNASYLSALFRKETGKTVTEYVSEKRMEAAAQLSRTTRLQIQTVAQHCGMSDVNYFSKLFKKHHGITPKQYREKNRPYFPTQKS